MRRVLIANRGEIAVRIARACRERDLEVVAVCSDADRAAPHVLAADEVVVLGGRTPSESYLDIDRIIEAARATGADAIHPGYGFLSEDPALPEACAAAGLTFIGPPAGAVRAMGSKIEARLLMEAAGVPCVPGVGIDPADADGVAAAAERLGYPVLVKASAGGGGRGMRRVDGPDALAAAVAAAQREAAAAFGDGTLFLERLLVGARHVEVQIAADTQGACIHLGERECSLQRRHQKVIEEAPSPMMSPQLREAMGTTAVAAALAVGYRNVGTVEFLVIGTGASAEHYFLEMNTRLQVEHPVTEAVTGVDLVHLQFDIAEGRPLPLARDAVTWRGHAIECRVYAEAPADGFLPQAGRLLVYREPSAPGVRVDGGVREGQDVPPYYDPLLAKVIASAETRPLALARMREALRSFVVLGVATNIDYLQRVLAHPDVQRGAVHTAWLDAHPELAQDEPPPPDAMGMAEAAAAVIRRHGGMHGTAAAGAYAARDVTADPFETLGAWRG